jgi:hypothetical protein
MATAALVSRIIFHDVGGVRLCALDFTGLSSDVDAFEAIDDAKRAIAADVPTSLRVLTDTTGSNISPAAISGIAELANDFAPLANRTAWTGLALGQRIALRHLAKRTGRALRDFASSAEALTWLTAS